MKRVMGLVVVMMLVAGAQAQNITYPCGHQDIFDIYQILVAELSDAVPEVDAQDTVGFFEALEDVESAIAAMRTECITDNETQVEASPAPVNQVIMFSSDVHGNEGVYEISLPAGVYITRLSTNGGVTVKLTELSGDCPPMYVYTSARNQTDIVEEEATVVRGDCRGLMEIDNYDNAARWTVEFEPVN